MIHQTDKAKRIAAYQYCRRIRNYAKRQYCEEYIVWKLNGEQGNPPEHGTVSAMAAQGVRLEIDSIGLDKPENNPEIESILDSVRRVIAGPYAFGHPQYVVMYDGGDYLCTECARENYSLIADDTRSGESGWRAIGVEVYEEGPIRYCGHCGVEIHSEQS